MENSIINEVSANNCSVQIKEVDLDMSHVTNDHTPIVVNTVLVPKCYKTIVVSNEVTDDKGLAKLLVTDSTRKFVISALRDESKIAAVMNIACVTRNDSVRLNTPISDYYLINRAVHEIYSESNVNIAQRTALAILFYRALTKWQMIALDRRVSTVFHEKAENVGESILASEIMVEQALRAVATISFRSVHSDRDYTNTKVLAALFCDSLSNVIPQLENLNRFQTALQSVLSRVYTFITKRVADNYAPEERAFTEKSNFLYLASNMGIIQMALDAKQLRPLSNVVFWDEQDAIIYDALMNNSLFEVVPLAAYKEKFMITRLISSRGKLSGAIISKQVLNSDVFETYYEIAVDKLKEYAPFTLTQEHDALVTNLLRSYNSSDAHNNATQLMESLISDSVSKLVMTIGIDNEQELHNLAASLADRILVDTKSGDMLFTKTLEKSQSNLQFSEFFPEYVTTDSAETMLLAAAYDYIGKSGFVSEVGYKPQARVKYANSHIIVSNTLKNKQKLKLAYSYDFKNDIVSEWVTETSFADLLKLDVSTPICTDRIELLSSALRRLINVSHIFDEQKYKLSGIGSDEELTEKELKDMPKATQHKMKELASTAASIEYVVSIRTCAFVDRLVSIAQNSQYFKTVNHNLLSQFVTHVRSNPSKFPDLKTGNIYSDEIIKRLFEYSTVNALLLLSGVYSYKDGYNDYELLNKFLVRRCLLINV